MVSNDKNIQKTLFDGFEEEYMFMNNNSAEQEHVAKSPTLENNTNHHVQVAKNDTGQNSNHYNMKVVLRLSNSPEKFAPKQERGYISVLKRFDWRLLGVIIGTIASAFCVEYAPSMSFIKAMFVGISIAFFGVLVALFVRLVKEWKTDIQNDNQKEKSI